MECGRGPPCHVKNAGWRSAGGPPDRRTAGTPQKDRYIDLVRRRRRLAAGGKKKDDAAFKEHVGLVLDKK